MTSALPELAKHLAKSLSEGAAECVICTEAIGRGQGLWSCRRCYGVLHLPCVIFWSNNRDQPGTNHHQQVATASNEFRCPLCQTAANTSTLVDKCFCGQVSSPAMDLALVPGTCGQTCNRRRHDPNCPHRCVAQCHPGPCPPCGHLRDQGCFCGVDDKKVGCSSGEAEYSCGAECGKELNCGRHYCEAKCHPGRCHVCPREQQLVCYCGKKSKVVSCSPESSYGCGATCEKPLDCGNHVCEARCHDGPCAPCLRTPARQTTCACGKKPVSALQDAKPRDSCMDPLPVCGELCDMPLPCGHMCKAKCHDGPCPGCVVMVEMPCRCGKSKSTHPCFVSYIQLPVKGGMNETRDSDDSAAGEWDEDNPDHFDKTPWLVACDRQGISRKTLPKLFPPRCPRKCSAKKLCGKHACSRMCCGEVDHICAIVCRKRAPCGVHECGQLCHRGPCPPCENVSFDPLYCRCRRSVVDPPVPCNTPPPRCGHPCILPRSCGHQPRHPCHMGDCPPCVQLVEKACASHGRPWHVHLPCSMPSPGCGKRCSKNYPCCIGHCDKPCHNGPCVHECKRRIMSIEEAMREQTK
jgi:transcriptional repressor NF-X1